MNKEKSTKRHDKRNVRREAVWLWLGPSLRRTLKMHDEELGKFMATGNWFTTCFLCLISPFRMESIIVSVCSSVPRFPMSCFFCCCYVLIICDAICHYLFHRLCIYILLPFGWTAIRFVIAMFTFWRAHSPSWTNICFTTSPEHWTCSHWAACHNIFGVCVCVFLGMKTIFGLCVPFIYAMWTITKL